MWSEFEFNPPYEGAVLGSVNGIDLPDEYLAFMKEHNGGEGNTDTSWLVLFPLEELQDINDDYEVAEYLPGTVIIGSNGGGELFGINESGQYFIVPDMMSEEDLSVIGEEIANLPRDIKDFWQHLAER